MDPYTITDATSWREVADEPQGGKQKVWLEEPGTARHWLFKVRSQGGDDWAERVAAEVASVLQIPCAVAELAVRDGQPGIISLDFTENREQGDLVLGNDLLLEHDPAYPAAGGRYRVTAHTVTKVITVLSQRNISVLLPNPHEALKTAAEIFLGYLLLDALVGNTDRHHENWGILRRSQPADPWSAVLAPTFDHAASLGQILQDSERQRRLETKDKGYSVEAYVRRARSALYRVYDDPRPLSLTEAFASAGQQLPAAERYWRETLRQVPAATLKSLVDRVPNHLASSLTKRFAVEMLHHNQRLLAEELCK